MCSLFYLGPDSKPESWEEAESTNTMMLLCTRQLVQVFYGVGLWPRVLIGVLCWITLVGFILARFYLRGYGQHCMMHI